MRAKWWVGFLTIAAFAPLGAQADIQVTKVADLWDGGHVVGLPDLSRGPVAAQSLPVVAQPQNKAAAVVREPSTIRAVDTYQGRGFKASTTAAAAGGAAVAPTRAAPPNTTPNITPLATAAPEMNSGLAAVGLTLLFGSVAILRNGRNRAR